MIGTYLRDMAQKLIKFGETKQLITAEEASENENKLLIRVMMVIVNYFKQPLSSLIFEFENGTPMDHTKITETNPYLVTVNEIFDVFIEKQKWHSLGTDSFADALQQMFATYYI